MMNEYNEEQINIISQAIFKKIYEEFIPRKEHDKQVEVLEGRIRALEDKLGSMVNE